MSEKEYLNSYDKQAFDTPLVTVDSVLFTCHEGGLKVLLVQRGNYPDKGKWGLPGGFVDLKGDVNLEDSVMRRLKQKTGVIPPYVEQLKTYGGAQRDKRGWSVTICYTALVSFQACQSHVDSVVDVNWITVDELPDMELAFDHSELIKDARARLKQKALYSIVPAYTLPEVFTLPELQHVHELLIGKALQKKSFRRRIEQAELLIDTGDKRSERGRPASLYRMKADAGDFNFIRNLEY